MILQVLGWLFAGLIGVIASGFFVFKKRMELKDLEISHLKGKEIHDDAKNAVADKTLEQLVDDANSRYNRKS